MCCDTNFFFSEGGLNALLSEAHELSEQAYYSPKKQCNIYLGDGNPAMTEDIPQLVSYQHL